MRSSADNVPVASKPPLKNSVQIRLNRCRLKVDIRRAALTAQFNFKKLRQFEAKQPGYEVGRETLGDVVILPDSAIVITACELQVIFNFDKTVV